MAHAKDLGYEGSFSRRWRGEEGFMDLGPLPKIF